MSLATRCSHCGTVFRVVQDQLKVSEGWVRCGRCGEVFNAVEGLFDLDREAPPEWTPSPAQPRDEGPELPAAPLATYSYHAPAPASAASAEPVAGAAPEGPAVAAQREPGAFAAEAATSEFDPLRPQRTDRQARPAAPAAQPDFVRAAEAEERWRSSPRRAALAVGVFAAAALLAGQWAHHFRDLVAARWPAVAPALVAWCGQIGCSVGPPRRIESITVDSSALARAGAPDQFRLGVTLRNRDSITLALPSIELTLTDSSGQLAARRALAPADFGVAAPLIAAGAEQSLALVLQAPDLRVAGYTVEIFYP